MKLPRVDKYFEGHYVVPERVTKIGHDAFNGCTGLTSIEIPNSVTEIGCRAFYGCIYEA